jgi:hypothetical protein
MSTEVAAADPPYRAKVTKTRQSYTVAVSSTPPSTRGMTVWHLRDFLRAIDAAGVPDTAEIDPEKSSVGFLTYLRTRHTFVVDEPDTQETQS